MNFLGLQKRDPCFAAVVNATLELPLSPPLIAATHAAVRRLPQPFASVHLRLSDQAESVAGLGGAVGDTRATEMSRIVDWLQKRLSKRVPKSRGVALFLASNLPLGVRTPSLEGLCGAVGAYNCTDLNMLALQRSNVWQSLLTQACLNELSA